MTALSRSAVAMSKGEEMQQAVADRLHPAASWLHTITSLNDFARMIRLRGGPVPERRPEAVRQGRDPMVLEHLRQRRRRYRLPRRVGKHEVAAVTVSECPRRVEDLNRPSARRTQCSHSAFVRRAETAYT